MAIVQKSFTLDIVPGYAPTVIHVSEYDIGRSYEVTLLNDGIEFIIPDGTTASIEGTLEDFVEYSVRIAKSIFNVDNLTISDNKIYFELNENMTPFSGQVWCKIKLSKDSKPISTCGFIMEIDRAGVSVTDIPQATGFEEQLRRAIAKQLPAAISDVFLEYMHGYSGPDQAAIDAMMLAAHPIGSYYWSDDPTDPGRIFGGVWTEVTDVFLYAAARDNQTEYRAGHSGGSKTHTLTVTEMPSHTHELGMVNPNGSQVGGSKLDHTYNPASIYYSGEDVIKPSGGGQAFSIMPPYYATYCWRRTE